MKRIVVSPQEPIAAFIDQRVRGEGYDPAQPTRQCIGILGDEGNLIAGVTFFNRRGQASIEAGIAGDGRKWMSRRFLWAMFDYPFVQLGVNRITVEIEEGNKDSIALAEHLGFTLETRKEKAGQTGDILIYRMFKEDCRWLRLGVRYAQ